MRVVCLLVALGLTQPVLAQDAERKKKKQAAHKKPTPEQIRKFNELEKKQKKKG